MRLQRIAISLVAGLFLALVALPSTAHAASNDEITRFDVVVEVADDGAMRVTQTMDVKFASRGHGPYVYFVTRQGYDDDQDRVIIYSDIKASSPTGAPADTEITAKQATTLIRIGDEDEYVSGTQTYVLSYTVEGIMNPKVESSGMDEIYWKIIGDDWEIPISNISVTVEGIAAVQDTTCYTGQDLRESDARASTSSDPECTSHSSSGNTATFTQDSLPAGRGLAVVAGWPAGTYPNAEIKLIPKGANGFTLAETGWIPATAAGGLTIASALGLVGLARKGRDRQFANVTPGSLPVSEETADIKRGEVKDAPVEFEPPQGVPPRLVGAIVREGTSGVDVTASVISMAVRGYIHLQGGEDDSFSLATTGRGPATLDSVERGLYDGLFTKKNRAVVTSKQISSKKFYKTYERAEAAIKDEFDAQGWYTTNPRATVGIFVVLGIIVAALGGLAMFIFSAMPSPILGASWIGVPFIVFGLGMVILAKRMPARTPVGSALAVKAFGFKKYLETAEGGQIRWEEGQDIFSEYLPYAIAFGCADRWATVFQDLAAAGAPVPQPVWYSGYGYGYYSWSSINHSIGQIGDSFQDSVAAHNATTGSSGGSGFGGGGFGGGVGGGGGGTW